MSKYIKVALSPFYDGLGWIDKKTGIKFVKGGLMQHYTIPVSSDLTDIKRQVMLNNLILIEGDLDLVVNQEHEEISKRDFETLKADNNKLKEKVAQLEEDNQRLISEINTLQDKVEAVPEPEPEPVSEPEPEAEQDVEETVGTEETEEVTEEVVEEETSTEPGVYSEEEASDLTVAKIKSELDRLEIDYASDARKAELVELLTGQAKAE